jgi:hypothetical protein
MKHTPIRPYSGRRWLPCCADATVIGGAHIIGHRRDPYILGALWELAVSEPRRFAVNHQGNRCHLSHRLVQALQKRWTLVLFICPRLDEYDRTASRDSREAELK